MKNRNLIIRLLLILTILISSIYAGNTGKVSGYIIDFKTREPLLGANVIVKGTSLGAATDEEGRFYILQIPPGIYSIEINYIGYAKVTVTNIKIQVDLTTPLNAELKPSSMQTEEVIVVAKKPMIQHDITSSREKMDRSELEKAPGVESAMDMFRLNGGAIMNVQAPQIMIGQGMQLHARDESLKDVHIRGGRGGEILYMVDGIPVNHPIYGGRSVLDLNINDVDEIELITGAFNAEYGQAQSGVVNITTRSGKSYYSGSLEYKTDHYHPIGFTNDMDYATFHFSGPGLLNKFILPKIGMKLPGQTNFFISGNVNINNTENNNGRIRDDLNVFGLNIKERQDNKGNLNGKLDWYSPNSKIHLTFSYHGAWSKWTRFDWLWKENPDNMVKYSRTNHHYAFKFNHTLSKSTFYNLNVGYLNVIYNESMNGKSPDEFWSFLADTNSVELGYNDWESNFAGSEPYDVFTNIESPNRDEVTGFFTPNSYETVWRDDDTKTLSLIGNLTSQINFRHKIKTGFEFQINSLQYTDIQDGGVVLSNYGRSKYGQTNSNEMVIAPPGPYPEFGQNRWVFDVKPTIGAFYIQDKYELESLIINAGIRMDMFWPGSSVFEDDYKEQWVAATGMKANWKKMKYSVSPRFGISFPISVKTKLFFSYGYFTQLPELQFVYRDPYSGGFTGNPGLGYEKTILYEYGFKQQLFTNWAIDLKAYAKDINNTVGTTRLLGASGIPVSLYDNKGYGRARGIEFKVLKQQSGYISGNATYIIQWAKGYSSSAFEDYIRSLSSFPNPIRERRTSWDVRNQIVFQANISVPKSKALSLFGFTLPSNWNATILSNFASGNPYTAGTNNILELQKTENNESGPYITTTDIKINKWFVLKNGMKISLSFDIFNIFNNNNVNLGWGFNTWTGKPFQYGDNINNLKEMYSWYNLYNMLDPRQFSMGRYAKIGLKFDF